MTPATLAIAWLDRALGLTRLSASDPRAELAWRFTLSAWTWALIALAAVAFAAWSYRRLAAPRPARIALTVVRAALLLLVCALLAGPSLLVPREIVDPDCLLVLVDRSASMRIADAVAPGGAPCSRDEALQLALQQHPDLLDRRTPRADRRVLWLAFDADTRPIPAPGSDAPLPPPSGSTTALRTAIEHALQRAAGQPLGGIVLFTDGRSAQPTGADLVRLLRHHAVSVFPVPLGSPTLPLDLAIERIDAPDRALLSDTVPVTVWVSRTPAEAPVDPAAFRLRLTDARARRVLDEQPLAGFDQPVRLAGQGDAPGPAAWRVELIPAVPAASAERITANNQRDLSVELIDQPIRVLYVEGPPRWEYRYLAPLLAREKALRSSILLASADASYAHEGSLPITRFPATAAELEPYDVIVLGDIPAAYFSAQQLALIRDHVASRGAGLLFIAGNLAMPRAYEPDPSGLADLLPMRHPAAVAPLDLAPTSPPTPARALRLQPTPLADALGVLRLRDRQGRPALWSSLAPLAWAQQLGPLKPGVEVLAMGQLISASDPAPRDHAPGIPLVLRLRFGAGQSVYVATDDTWRWRRARGEADYQQFWVQLLQMLGRGRVQQPQGPVALDLSASRLDLGQPLLITARVRDALLLQRDLPRLALGIWPADHAAGPPPERLDLLPLAPHGSDASRREYQALHHPSRPGRYIFRLLEPSSEQHQRELDVLAPDDEWRQPATDHPRLAQLARQTGGQVVPLDELPRLDTLIPNRARRTPDDVRQTIWDSPLALGLLVTLLTLEWTGRKLIRLN